MIASHTAVSSSLTSLPAFETEHTLYLAEQNLVQPRNDDNANNDDNNSASYGHSAALQALADAYVNRRAGDRGDNLVRAAALLTRAASLPAGSNKQCEKDARAAALSRLGRAHLARSQLDLRFIHPVDTAIDIDIDVDPSTEIINDNFDLSDGPEKEVDPAATLSTEEKIPAKPDTAKSDANSNLPEVPRYLQLARNPNPNVSRVAQKALLATTAAAEAVAAGTPNFDKLKAAFESAEQSAAASVDDKAAASGVAALASLGEEFSVLRNTLAALHVDRARALIVGASPGIAKDATVEKRAKEAMNALKLASKLRVPSSRRQKAAGALADIMLATLYSRTRGKISADGKEVVLEESDRVRAARLYRASTAALVALFSGGGTTASDTESTLSATPPTSPMTKNTATPPGGSDCSTGSLSASPNGAKKTNVKIPEQDPFEPFVDWDLDEVRKFVDEESKRLGPVMQEGEGRRSCTLF